MKRYTGEVCSFEQLSVISKALSERYTGVFFIDLTEDSYISIRALDTVAALIADLPSARAALLSAIESTTHSEFLREMEKFVDLTTLPERMENTDCISKTYRSKISGWICGSFMEAKRENGRLTQVLYTYQVVEEEQRREEKQTQDSAAIERYQQIQAAVGTVDDVLNNVGLLDNISSEAELRRMLPILLASLGRYAMADRAYLFKWASQDRQVMRMTYEWCADGVEPTMGKMQSVSLSDMPNWMPRLNRGEAILAMDWDAERTKTPEEFVTFDGQNIHSLMVIPIFTNKTLNGYVGFDNPAQSRYALSLRLLNAVGGHLGALTENLRMMTELEEKQRSLQNSLAELNREKKILDALSVDYTSVYFCDLDADLMIALKQGELTNSAVAEKALKEGLQSYAFRIRYYYDNFIVQESAPDFLTKMSAEYLKEYLSRNNRLAYRFRTDPNPAGQQYFEVQIVRLTDAGGFKAVMGYRYIDDIIAEQEEQKIKLEEALAKATLNSEIVGAISKLYWLIYRMDLVKGTYEEISAGQEMHQLTGKRGSTAEVFREVRETIVCREHQRIMAEFLDTSTLAERLRDTESVEMEYRAVSGSWHLGRFIVKKRDDDGRVTNVLYVVRQIDKQKQQELEYKQKLIATAEEAKRANIAKTDFLRRMSHDIRTPINGIRGIVSIANHYPEDIAKQEDCRNKVMQASGFLLDLVNSVLDMNKLESGVVVLDHKPFDLRDILEETCSIIEMQAQEYAVPLERKPRRKRSTISR